MRGKNIVFITVFIFFILIISCLSTKGLDNNKKISNKTNSDFYFIHMTDIHIMHESFGDFYNKYSKERLLNVLNEINSFENKPVFLVITGDLVEWGSGHSGALNYETLTSCFFEENGQFYINSEHTIPVYFTPGNHDYYINWNLDNYFKYIKNERKYIVTYEDVTLFFMDSGPHYIMEPKKWLDVFACGLEDKDIIWLNEKLTTCDTEHKIVLMHHPAVNVRNEDGEMYDVLLNNREVFIQLCKQNDVDLVLAGHTHKSRVFDSDENQYFDYPINTTIYQTLFVQSKANKLDEKYNPDCNYRNISVINGNIYIEENVKVDVQSITFKSNIYLNFVNSNWMLNLLKCMSIRT